MPDKTTDFLRSVLFNFFVLMVFNSHIIGEVIVKRENNFTEGRIFAPLIMFALPVLLALLLQTAKRSKARTADSRLMFRRRSLCRRVCF